MRCRVTGIDQSQLILHSFLLFLQRVGGDRIEEAFQRMLSEQQTEKDPEEPIQAFRLERVEVEWIFRGMLILQVTRDLPQVSAALPEGFITTVQARGQRLQNLLQDFLVAFGSGLPLRLGGLGVDVSLEFRVSPQRSEIERLRGQNDRDGDVRLPAQSRKAQAAEKEKQVPRIGESRSNVPQHGMTLSQIAMGRAELDL
jgi:hypothetical protein